MLGRGLGRCGGGAGRSGLRRLSSRGLSTSGRSGKGRKSPLHSLHLAEGGKMVEFAGWQLPVTYQGLSLKDSVRHTRAKASLFDVSHMLQTEVRGLDRVGFMESLVTGDVAALAEGTGTLSVFTNAAGGIEDDLIIVSEADRLFLVSNAACAHKDLPYMQDAAAEWRGRGNEVTVEALEDRALVALQGPAVPALLAGKALEGANIQDLHFMRSVSGVKVLGVEGCRVTRCGYTGEDGVEISVASERAEELGRRLLGLEEVAAAGLGARDALRLEAGLCLYGADLDETTTPAEAALAWLVPKRRRAEGGFPGADRILSELRDKSWTRRRVGLVGEGRPGRAGALLRCPQTGDVVGSLTSGLPSPTLGLNVAMGYVSRAHAKAATDLIIDHSGKDAKPQKITVAKMPFVPTHYYQPAKQ